MSARSVNKSGTGRLPVPAAAAKLQRGQSGGEVVKYDPEKGLATIATAEAGERHFRRARDVTKLCIAIEAKMIAQAEYVVWRDGVPIQPHAGPGRGKKNRVAAARRGLPKGDPGKDVINRWRKAFCKRVRNGTVVDGKKIEDTKRKLITIIDRITLGNTIDDAKRRCTRICEKEKDGTIRGTEGTGEFERYTPARFGRCRRR